MKFCPNCHNILYTREHNNELISQCSSCGYTEKCEDTVIEKKNYKMNHFGNVNNKYLRYDPSLPHTVHKKCPNNKCESHSDKSKQDAVFITDKSTLSLIYICTVCNTEWKYN